jgi:hypothetical protein
MIKYKSYKGGLVNSKYYATKYTSPPIEEHNRKEGMHAEEYARFHIKQLTPWLEPFNRALQKWEEKLDSDELQQRRHPQLTVPPEPVRFLRQDNGRLVPIIVEPSLSKEEGQIQTLPEARGEDG